MRKSIIQSNSTYGTTLDIDDSHFLTRIVKINTLFGVRFDINKQGFITVFISTIGTVPCRSIYIVGVY